MSTILEALRELKNQTEVVTIVEDFELDEDLSDVNIQPLPRDEVYNFIKDVKPGKFFHVGYMREVKPAAAHKNTVKIIKCSEYYGSTGIDYENKSATINMRAETGKERSGNVYEFDMSDLPNKIGVTHGVEMLQFYPRSNSHPYVKYFISVEGEPMRETDRHEVATYLTPADANKLVGTKDTSAETTPSGAQLIRLKLSGIYYIGNLGSSIM